MPVKHWDQWQISGVQIGFPFIIIVFFTSSPKPWVLTKKTYPGKRGGTGVLTWYSKKQDRNNNNNNDIIKTLNLSVYKFLTAIPQGHLKAQAFVIQPSGITQASLGDALFSS